MRTTTHLALILGLLLYGCSGDGQNGVDSGPDAGVDGGAPDGTADGADDDPSQWSHERLMAEAKVLRPPSANGLTLLFVEGNPYQMGYQHGYLMKDEILEFRESLETDFIWKMMMDCLLQNGPDPVTNSPTYAELSLERSFDFIVEECRGMVHGSDAAITLEECTVHNSFVWAIEDAFNIHLPEARALYGCSQFAAANEATLDGNMIHGRNQDFMMPGSIMENPLIMIKKPEGKLKIMSMAWPSMIANFTGMNEAGLAVSINDHLCLPDPEVYNMEGVPHLQLLTKVLQEASDLDQALALVDAEQASGCSHFFMSHGPSKNALVIEISANHSKVRYMENGVLYATNHFIEPDVMDDQDVPDIENMESHTVTRFTRLMERLTGQSKPPHAGLAPDAPDYAHGRIDVEMAIDIMRDPTDLRPGSNRQCFPCDKFENQSWAIGNNYNVSSHVFLPGELKFFSAAGWDEECRNPVYNPYVGFDLNELFNGTYTEGLVPTYDPDYNCPGE